ncbi:MAG: ABC transporter ATP-binding protein [Flavobacteriales bacterium]|nr:MAG: ABC transporter ATP-binding protein [Flavobacteriales bacterium]
MPLKAVLFDMDGVIVNTEPLHRKAYFKMFEDFNMEVSEELYTSFTGASTKKVCNHLIQEFQLDKTTDELINTKRAYFKNYFDNDPDFDLIEGVREIIQHYYDNGIKLVLASSASMNTINWVFEKFDLEQYFIGKISGADLKESKPNPEIFVKAAEMANEPKENCMVIEDSTNGILAAHRAEIFCAAYQSEHSKLQDYSKANILVDDYKELEIDKLDHF